MLNVPATPPWSRVTNKISFHDCMCYEAASLFLCPGTLAVISPGFTSTSALLVLSVQGSCGWRSAVCGAGKKRTAGPENLKRSEPRVRKSSHPAVDDEPWEMQS